MDENSVKQGSAGGPGTGSPLREPSAPQAPGGPAGDAGEASLPPWARVVRRLVGTVVYRFTFAWGVLFVAIAVACLSIAWKELSGQEQSILERMTATGTVKILDSAVEILPASGPDVKMDPSRVLWHHDFRFEHVLELRYLPDHPVRVYRSARVTEFEDAGFWTVLERESLFKTAHVTVKMETGLYELMRKTPAQAGVAFSVLDAPENAPREQREYMGSQFDQFWVSFDRPMHALALEWLSDSRDLETPVRYNPAASEEFLLDKTYQAAKEGSSRILSIVVGVLLGGFGLFILLFAVGMLTQGANRYVPLVLYGVIVVAVPVGSRQLQTVIDYLGLPPIEKSIIEELSGSMDPRVRAGFLEEMSLAQQSALVTLRVDVPHSRYSDVFGFFHLSRDGRRFSSFNEAMQAISAQLAEQLASMPANDQFRFFMILDNHMGQRREGWDGPFLEGVRELALDSARSPALRSWAISALCDMCLARKDVKLAEFIYGQYTDGDPAVRQYWRGHFFDYVRAPSFAEDLRSPDPARIRRALEIWEGDHHFLEDVRQFAPRLKELTKHPDPRIRELAVKQWNSRTDWEERR